MASEELLSSLSAYTAVIAVLITLATVVLTERVWHIVTSTARSARTALRPSEGTCERRLWADLDAGPLHVCTSSWPPVCHQRQHVGGARCWERSLTMVVNHWNAASPTHVVDKPKILPLSKEFVHVDLKVILAFIFMASRKGSSPAEGQSGMRTLHVGGAVLQIQTVKPELVLLHLEGTLDSMLTKDYVERLLRGYPPLLKDPQNVSVLKAGDEARGGWVAALGLESHYDEKETFLPVYSDCVLYKDRRGHVFWRSMDRVRCILTDIWAKAFSMEWAASNDIAITIKALKYIHEHETESGVEHSFKIRMPSRPLSAQEKSRIITHFNGPPLIAVDEEEQFQAEWEPLLHYVLVAAVQGSVRCIAYFKNPGRELEDMLPMDVLKPAKLYLRGC